MPATATGTTPVQTLSGRGLTLLLLGAAFHVATAAFVLPAVAEPLQRAVQPAPLATGPPAPLTAAEQARVLGYAGAFQPDDALVDVRSGVQAKRSNVEGVRLGTRTVYYDVLGHQSYGPLGRGRVTADGVDVLARDGSGPFQVVVYTLREPPPGAAVVLR